MLNLQQDGEVGAQIKAGQDTETLQKAKKVLRTLSELSSRIDEATSKCNRIEDLFSPSLLSLRAKLRECAGTATTSSYISGALDIAWRKGSYEVLHVSRKLSKNGQDWAPSERNMIKAHLAQSFGFYQNLCLSFDSFGSDFEHQVTYGYLAEDEKKPIRSYDDNAKRKTMFKCHMFLGDLTRYQIEFAVSKDEKEILSKIAKKYYLESLSVDPSHGQPFNQLAALSGTQCYGIIAAYYYLRCLTSEQKFEAAEGNLKKILDKASKTQMNGHKDGKREMATSMLILFHNLLFEESTKNLSELCRQALEQVSGGLYQESGNISSQASTHSVLCLFLIKAKCTTSKKTKVAMINAFLLAWLSHLTTKILADLKFHLFGPDAVMEIFNPPKPEKEVTSENNRNGNRTHDNEKNAKKKADSRRRRRRIIDSDEEDMSENDQDSESNLDEDENDEEDEDSFDEFSADEFDSDSGSSVDDILIEESENIITGRKVMTLYQNHPMLEPFQLCCQWLMNSPEVIEELDAQNSEVLWTRLAMLVNILDVKQYEDLENLKIKTVDNMAFAEDKVARGMRLFQGRQKRLDFDVSLQFQSDQVGLARLQQMEEVKLWLCRLPQFKMTEEAPKKLEFRLKLGPKLDKTPETEPVASEASEKDTQKTRLMMENMATLWLQQEVKDLEGLHSEASGKYSPFLVVDHTVMINHICVVKDIVACKRFTIIVPTSVVQQLDAMKKSDGRARTAIRWLEKQFHQGNRWLRGQRSHESKSLEVASYPKRKEKDSWHFFKILECSNHFLGQSATKSSSSKKPTVTLIIANEHHELMHVAKSQGIEVETVEEFLARNKIPKKKGSSKKTKKKENG